MSNLEELEKTLWNKKTKEALSKSLSGTFGTGLRELWISLNNVFWSSKTPSWTYEKNQITKELEDFEQKRTKKRSIKVS